MKRATWTHEADGDATLEENWLFRVKRERWRSLYSTRAHDFFVMELADAVTVIALTPSGHVVLVRQFRAASMTSSLEPPGGLVDAGEDPGQAAARELLEETGYEGDPPVLLASAWANPSILRSRIATVLITNARQVAAPRPDANEEVHVELVRVRDVPRLLRDGTIHHALAVQGLLVWLVSQLPESPWALPRSMLRRPRQLHIRGLMVIVLVCSLLFALFRLMGWGGTILTAVVLSGILPPILWPRLSGADRSILLQASQHSLGNILIGGLASLGAWAFGVIVLWFVFFVFHIR